MTNQTKTTTYTINPGNRYNYPGGYRIKQDDGRLVQYGGGRYGLNRDGEMMLFSDGNCKLFAQPNVAELEAAIMQTLDDGQERVITHTVEVARKEVSPEWKSHRGLTLTEEMDLEDSDY